MIKFLQVAALALVCLTLTNCSRVSPGYVGIQSTVVGSDRGLQDAAVGPAWVFHNPFTVSVFEYPTFVQTAVWTQNTAEGKPVNEEITFTNKDRMQISADISLAYQLDPQKAAAFYLRFRTDDMTSFTDGLMRNLAREKFDAAAGKYDVNQIMGDNAAFLADVRTALQGELTPFGIKLVQFGFIGAPRPPKAVTDSINMSVQATQIAQQKQNEVVQATADAAKEVARAEGDAKATLTRAQSQAQANKILSESLTPTLKNFINIKGYSEYRKIDKWDGKLPEVTTSGEGIMLGLPAKQ